MFKNKFSVEASLNKVTTEKGFTSEEDLRACEFIDFAWVLSGKEGNPNLDRYLIKLNPLYSYYEAVDGLNEWLASKANA